MRTIKGIYFVAMGMTVTAVLFLACVPVQAAVSLGLLPKDGRGLHRIASLWGQLVFFLMPGWTVKVSGREHLPKFGSPMVIVANHESVTDIFAMYFLGLQFRWLSKEEVFKLPLIGQAMRWANYVPVRRGDPASHAEAMAASGKRLAQGLSMFFFPEGTRSRDGQVGKFKVGAFKLAQDHQVPILPIAIHGSANLLPKGSLAPGKAKVRMQVMAPLPPPAKDADLRAYAESTRELIIAAHAKLVAANGTELP